jgi:hypothetical protein
MAFAECIEIRYMHLPPFICEERELQTNEERKTKTIHFTNGCAK